jgi:hypothetical protein
LAQGAVVAQVNLVALLPVAAELVLLSQHPCSWLPEQRTPQRLELVAAGMRLAIKAYLVLFSLLVAAVVGLITITHTPQGLVVVAAEKEVVLLVLEYQDLVLLEVMAILRAGVVAAGRVQLAHPGQHQTAQLRQVA